MTAAARGLGAAALAGMAACLLASCISPRYKLVKSPPPSAPALNAGFPPGLLEATLGTVIIYGGAGSWKQEAFWDEYVVAFRNSGDAPIEIISASLVDSAGIVRSSGDDPWALEKESKTLEARYRDVGMAFARVAGPRVFVVTAQPAIVAGVGIGSAGAAAIAAVTVVALPVYAVAIWNVNRHNKAAIGAEFRRRRLAFPLSLSPGETRAGSLFFPMTPSPRLLAVRWASASASGEAQLELPFLDGLHQQDSSADHESDAVARP